MRRNMSDKMELFLGLIVLLVVVAGTRRYHAWRIRRAYQLVVDDLESAAAHSAETAVDLPYSGKNIMRMGIRDHRKMALNHLVMDQVVGQTPEGRYFLLMKLNRRQGKD